MYLGESAGEKNTVKKTTTQTHKANVYKVNDPQSVRGSQLNKKNPLFFIKVTTRCWFTVHLDSFVTVISRY